MISALEVRGVSVPAFIYGTAWKEERTADLVVLALSAGFRAIDTANQRRHYFEEGVGDALERSGLPREELFLQSKFTYQRGQDHRLPYDPRASLSEQVRQSFESSLEHLGTDYLDSFVLHGPAEGARWGDADREVWQAMESIQRTGRARLLGVSNVAPHHLATLLENCEVPPAFVQNRCYARDGWDRGMRELCQENGVVYQGFSLLTANRTELDAPAVLAIAARHDASVPEVVFCAMQRLAVVPLTGTSNIQHMHQDLASHRLELSDEEIATITSGLG